MCLGWKFKLGSFCGTRCWVEMAILAFLLWPRKGADQNARTQENDEPSGSVGRTGGWGHISRVTKRSAYLNRSSTPCEDRSSFLLEKAFLLQGEKNCGNWSLCLICSARQKWDGRPTGILGVTLSQQVIQTWAAFYPVWSGTGSLPTCPALKLKELREWGNCLGEPDQGRTRIENGC